MLWLSHGKEFIAQYPLKFHLAIGEEWGRTKWPNDETSIHQTFDDTGPTGPT